MAKRKAKSPAFQFYPNDWLSSPNIMLMTPAEEGAYIRLLAICWMNGGLPDNDEQLAMLSRLGEGWFEGGSTKIRKQFTKRRGKLINKRLEDERKKQVLWSNKSRQGGIASGKSRKDKGLQQKPIMKGGSDMVATKDEPKGNSSSSSSSSSSKTTKSFTSDSDEVRLSELLFSLMIARNPNFKKPQMQTWAKSIDLMIRVDGNEPDLIEKVIRWVQSDDFWRSNILSTSKLRKQFNTLMDKALSNEREATPTQKQSGQGQAGNGRSSHSRDFAQHSDYGETIAM